MEKTIKIGKKNVRLSNNAGWILTYRDQFHRDIIPTIMPLIASICDVITGVVQQTGKVEEAEITDILKVLDGDTIMNAFIHLSGLEFYDFVNIMWCMAKEVDEDIPEPKIWIRGFEIFPLDEIVPKVADLIFRGLVSTKNQKRLETMIKDLQPKKEKKNQSQQTTSSSEASSED